MSDVRDKLSILPSNPGCYLYKNDNGKVIYVGKAKNLKNRVRSYFTGSHNAKTTKLIANIADFDFIVTNTEVEALLLELNLIKQHQPKYNILLIDNKTYPYIQITNHIHPMLLVTRNKVKGKGTYYGPYPHVTAARNTVKMLNKVFPLRKCHKIPRKECLYYHMNQCLGPCIKTVNQINYDNHLSRIKSFLRGNTKDISKLLEEKMYYASGNMDYESAAEYKQLLEEINIINEKQNIDIKDMIDRDIFGYHYDDNDICIHVFYLRQGKLVSHTSQVFSYYGEDHSQVFNDYLIQFYNTANNILPKEILIQDNNDFELLSEVLGSKVIIPKKGQKKQLVDMSIENAKIDLENKKELYRVKVESKVEVIEELGKLLKIDTPYHIECFDNSNIQGSNPISAMVVFKNGAPSKKDYRKYNIKTVEGPDDYASMKEVIYRRYYKVLLQDLDRTDLIIVDGGKGQVSVAEEIIDSLNLDIPVIGLKKDDKHKTDSIIFKNQEISLDKHSDLFRFLFSIQEEVHRFAISFHRQVRSKSMFSSILDEVDGIGENRRNKILMEFKTLENIRNATLEDYKKIGIGEELALRIKDHLNR